MKGKKMEWKYLEKEPPKHEGKYLVYTLKGKISINKYVHLFKAKRTDGSEYFTEYTGTYGYEDIGFHFVTNARSWVGRGPMEDVLLYAEIPPIPDDLDKKNSQIKEYQAKIRKLKAKIAALQSDD